MERFKFPFFHVINLSRCLLKKFLVGSKIKYIFEVWLRVFLGLLLDRFCFPLLSFSQIWILELSHIKIHWIFSTVFNSSFWKNIHYSVVCVVSQTKDTLWQSVRFIWKNKMFHSDLRDRAKGAWTHLMCVWSSWHLTINHSYNVFLFHLILKWLKWG